MSEHVQLYKDTNASQAVYPYAKVEGITNEDGTSLEALLDDKVSQNNLNDELDDLASRIQVAVDTGYVSKGDLITITHGGTGATTAAAARTNLGLNDLAVLKVAPISNGGTGATTAAAARSNLELGSVATLDNIPIAQGGTGATKAADALTNLGAVAKAGDTMTGHLHIQSANYPTVYLEDANGAGCGSVFGNASTKRTSLRCYATDGSGFYENYRAPAASDGLSANATYDILTTKAPITIAQGGTGATTAAAARTSLGAVNIAGDTMTGALTTTDLTLDRSSGNDPRTIFKHGGTQVGIHYVRTTDAKNVFAQYLGDVVERFALPAVTNASGDTTYNILTSKSAVTMAQGGTGATTGANGLKNLFAAGNTILSSYQYGSSLPAKSAATAGRIFFKKVT